MKIRDLLKKNEIYFTTITAVSLAFVSVLLTIQGNRNSKAQTAIAQRQEEMEYFSNLPTFQIEQFFFWNKDTTQIKGLELEVSKIDGNAKNIFVSSLTVLNVEFDLPRRDDINDYIFLDDFFHSVVYTGNLDGKICAIKGFSNNYLSLRHVANELKDIIKKDSADYAVVSQETYIEISYTDFINKLVVNYYKLSPVGASLLYDSKSKSEVKHLYKERSLHGDDMIHMSITDAKESELKDIYKRIKNKQ